MSKTLADHISSHKHLKWIDDQIVESKGVLRVIPLMMGSNMVFLDFHNFDVPEGENFVLIERPIEPRVHPNRDWATLEVKVGNETISVSQVSSCNTIAEARPEQNPVEEAVCTIQEGQTQPILEEDATHFTQETDLDS